MEFFNSQTAFFLGVMVQALVTGAGWYYELLKPSHNQQLKVGLMAMIIAFFFFIF